MGSSLSKSFDFQCDFAIYIGDINTIETDDPTIVYSKVMEYKFCTKKQMHAVAVIVFDKIVSRPELAAKCVQLLCLLKDEDLNMDGEEYIFHVIFTAYFLGVIKSFINNYSDETFTSPQIALAKNMAEFVGDLYNVDFIEFIKVIEIAQIIKEKETPKNAFFMDIVLHKIAGKLAEQNIPQGLFRSLIETYETIPIAISEEHSDLLMERFGEFLDKLKHEKIYEPFQYFDNFRDVSDEVVKMEIKILIREAFEVEEFLAIYRDVAVNLYLLKPNPVLSKIKSQFDNLIYDINIQNNVSKFQHLEKMIFEFFRVGLIEQQIVDKYMDVAMSRNLPVGLFIDSSMNMMKSNPLSINPSSKSTVNKSELPRSNSLEPEPSSSTSKNSAPSSVTSKKSELLTYTSKKIESTTSKTLKSNETSESEVPTSTASKLSIEEIKNLDDFCSYFSSATTIDDHEIFATDFISTLKVTKKEQVADFSRCLITRVMDGDAPMLFFVNNTMKMSQILSKNWQFRKVFIDEALAVNKVNKNLVEFMCELFNRDFINKQLMSDFVGKFMNKKAENLTLLYIFVRVCGLKLTKLGDKQLLTRIKNILKSIKSSNLMDENAKFLAQDLGNSLTSMTSLMEDSQKKPKEPLNEEEMAQMVNEIVEKALITPFVAAKVASKLDEKLKQFLIPYSQIYIENVPNVQISTDKFENLMEFIAELYNLEVIDNKLINSTIEIFLQHTNDEMCCKSLEILLENCGEKLETSNKEKLDIYFKFFEVVLAENEDSPRIKYFKKFIKLRLCNWKLRAKPKNFHEDFLILNSIGDAKIEELIDILKYDDDEIDKFILGLWKVLLKETPHPSYAILCYQISNSCRIFEPKLSAFLESRSNTFRNLPEGYFTVDVMHRFGKIVLFVTELYDKNMLNEEMLLMWINNKFVDKIPIEFIVKVYGILRNSEKLEHCGNCELKKMVDNMENIWYEQMNRQVALLERGILKML